MVVISDGGFENFLGDKPRRSSRLKLRRLVVYGIRI